MKCMMSVDGRKILRVTEDKAQELYMEGFRYVPKSMWKEKVRDIDKPKPTEEEPTKNKNNEMSRATKRHLKKSKNK